MILQNIEAYHSITIQCHDNPDADAIASGFALYEYLCFRKKQVKLIYCGRYEIQKNNLMLFIKQLQIPLQYERIPEPIKEGLLVTVDCQYGAGNVTWVEAKNIVVLDHHQVEINENDNCVIRPMLGSCSTLIWDLLRHTDFPLFENKKVMTALYYGLFMDTSQFSELTNPLDRDMIENVSADMNLIKRLRNSNLSLAELETAGIALIKNIYNERYRYAIIKSKPCDPNILGIISDFLLQVAEIDACVVYNEAAFGYKLSVRSCKKEVRANELAEYLCDGIGSGGGHLEKAGGFISKKLYERKYQGVHSEAFFGERLNHYFEDTVIIDSAINHLDVSDFQMYRKKKVPLGFVKGSDVYPVGTSITVRTLEGDLDIQISDELIIMIGMKGEVYPSTIDKFEKSYKIISDHYESDNGVRTREYIPMIKNRDEGIDCRITQYAGTCVATDASCIYAKRISGITKVFGKWDRERYMTGREGDFLAVRRDDAQDIYIVEKSIFPLLYDAI